jgi:hypothetical protein
MNDHAKHRKNLIGLLIICCIILIMGGVAVYFSGVSELFKTPNTGRNRIPFSLVLLAALVGLCYSIYNLNWLSKKRR